MLRRNLFLIWMLGALTVAATVGSVSGDEQASVTAPDAIRTLQSDAVRSQAADWGRWGNQPGKYSTWTNHSNRLIPVYTFGMSLGSWRESGSPFSDPDELADFYGVTPTESVAPNASYYDQTQIHDLMQLAVEQGKRHLIVMVFDGMDWQTTRAAAIYRSGADRYDSGRGRGLSFQDYRGTKTDFAFVVTSPFSGGAKPDVDAQTIRPQTTGTGGFSAIKAGPWPWTEPTRSQYPLGLDRLTPHSVTDSAASATSLFSGIKTYNGSINVDPQGNQVTPIARVLQTRGFRVGAVSSVPLCHATPACTYANNVSRKDYQDLSRDMLGLPSVSHRGSPLPGMDVVLGGGFGKGTGKSGVQGSNFLPGNQYLHESDIEAAKSRYVFATRTNNRTGEQVLREVAESAIGSGKGLLGLFGVGGGHLPYRTADGDYLPTFDVRGAEQYSVTDQSENPTLAQMTRAALRVLSTPVPTSDTNHASDTNDASDGNDGQNAIAPFWLMVEPGDVDWANHSNNIDNSIGAVLSGEAAFNEVTRWVEANDAWDDTVVIVTADHGHFLVIEDPAPIAAAGQRNASL